MKALVVASHPDDAEIGMGGTICSLISSGHEVVLVDLTDGEPTPFGTPEIRAKEAMAASTVLGLTRRINLGLKNREVFDTVENRKLLAEVIREEKPNILFGQYYEDTHPDHLSNSALVDAARFYSKFVKTDMKSEPHYPRKVFYYFSTHIKPKINPSFIYDISGFFEQKIKALLCFHSQFIANPKNIIVEEQLRVVNKFWGMQVGFDYGEPFVSREYISISSAEALFKA